jgi:hypothetical protein
MIILRDSLRISIVGIKLNLDNRRFGNLDKFSNASNHAKGNCTNFGVLDLAGDINHV